MVWKLKDRAQDMETERKTGITGIITNNMPSELRRKLDIARKKDK